MDIYSFFLIRTVVWVHKKLCNWNTCWENGIVTVTHDCFPQFRWYRLPWFHYNSLSAQRGVGKPGASAFLSAVAGQWADQHRSQCGMWFTVRFGFWMWTRSNVSSNHCDLEMVLMMRGSVMVTAGMRGVSGCRVRAFLTLRGGRCCRHPHHHFIDEQSERHKVVKQRRRGIGAC